MTKYTKSVPTILKENNLFPISNNLPFDLRIIISVSHYQVFINSMKVFNFTDETYTEGKYGFRVYYGFVDFLVKD